MSTEESICLTFNSDFNSGKLASMAIKGICLSTNLPLDDIDKIELCCVEVINNAIEHSYDEKLCGISDKKIEAIINVSNINIKIIINNWGIPMKHPLNHYIHKYNNSLIEELAICGRGLSIVNKVMDEFSYNMSDKKNTFLMIKHL